MSLSNSGYGRIVSLIRHLFPRASLVARKFQTLAEQQAQLQQQQQLEQKQLEHKQLEHKQLEQKQLEQPPQQQHQQLDYTPISERVLSSETEENAFQKRGTMSEHSNIHTDPPSSGVTPTNMDSRLDKPTGMVGVSGGEELEASGPSLDVQWDERERLQRFLRENSETASSSSAVEPPSRAASPPRCYSPSSVTVISPRETLSTVTLQAGILIVASTRPEIRRAYIDMLCEAAIEKSAIVYAISPSGGASVTTNGVFRLTTHPTLSRRALLSALLRHGCQMLIFGVINTRDDAMALFEAAYTGYHCVAEMFAESANDVLARLESIGVDVAMLPSNLRIVVPFPMQS